MSFSINRIRYFPVEEWFLGLGSAAILGAIVWGVLGQKAYTPVDRLNKGFNVEQYSNWVDSIVPPQIEQPQDVPQQTYVPEPQVYVPQQEVQSGCNELGAYELGAYYGVPCNAPIVPQTPNP